MTKFTLRPYQSKCLEDCIKYIDSNSTKKVIVIQPVGSGKGLQIASVANYVKEPVIVLQSNRDLLKQNYQKYLSYGNPASIYSASLGIKELGHVTFGTIGSIKAAINEIKQLGVKLLIIDECHAGTKHESQIGDFIQQTGIQKVIGFTGTPVETGSFMGQSYLKMLNRSRKNLFQEIIHCTQVSEIKDQFWTKIIYDIREVNVNKLKLNSTGRDYTSESLDEFYRINTLKEKILYEVNKLQAEGRKSILVFVPSIHQAEEISNFIPNSACVHSKTPDKQRNALTEAFKNLQIGVMLNVDCFGVGYDHPELSGIIEARPTNSYIVYYQHFGRGVRQAEGKENCKMLCMSGNYAKFGRLEDIEFKHGGDNRWGMFGSNGVQLTVGDVFKEDKKKQDVFDGVLWFGKFKGKPLNELPTSYLQWMLKDFSAKTPKVRQMLKQVEEVLSKK